MLQGMSLKYLSLVLRHCVHMHVYVCVYVCGVCKCRMFSHIHIFFYMYFLYIYGNERVKCFGFMQLLQATLQLFSYYLNNQYLRLQLRL